MSGHARRDALSRLAGFLCDELAVGELPEDLRAEYTARLERIAYKQLLDDPTPVADLGLSPRARSALERAGVDSVGKLASLSEAERAALPYMGPKYLTEVREELARRAAAAADGKAAGQRSR